MKRRVISGLLKGRNINIGGHHTSFGSLSSSTILAINNNNYFNYSTSSGSKLMDSRKEMFPEEAAIFEKIVLQRKAIKSFNPDKPVPIDVLNHILALTQRAPTGFNLQPWTAIVVSDQEKKKALHQAALSQPKILEAPITVVFAANLNALANQSKVISMNVQNGIMNENEAASMSRNTSALLKSDPACIIQTAKFVVGSVWSLFKPMMVPPINMKAYVWKQTMMPVQTFMLAAGSHGLDTCPMEGFDERRVRQVVGLPCNYSIPIIVSLGYASDHDINKKPQSLRLNPEEQFFDNNYGNQKKDIQSFNERILSSNSSLNKKDTQ